MKKKLLGLISVVLSLCMLCACNSGLSLNSGSFDMPTFTPAAAPVALFDKEVDFDDVETQEMGKFILFHNDGLGVEGGKLCVLYNVETATVVKEWTMPDRSEEPDTTQAGSITTVYYIELIGDYDLAAGWMVVDQKFEWEANGVPQASFITTIYNTLGESVATASTELVSVDDRDGMMNLRPIYPEQIGKNFLFDDALYRCIEDGDDVVIEKDESYGPFSFIPKLGEYTEVTEDYIYNMNGYELGRDFYVDYVDVYNHNFEKIGCYNVGYFDHVYYNVDLLENGNLFFQYGIYLPDNAEEYDVYFEGEKIDVITEVYNVEKDSVEQIDCDYIVEDIRFGREGDIFDGAADNIIYASKIENKRVNEDESKYYTMSNDGKIEDNFPELIPNQMYVRTAMLEDRFIALDKNGTQYFVTGSGEILGVLPGDEYITPAGIVFDGKIYDKDLKVVVDYEEEGYYFDDFVLDKLIFTKDYEDADKNMQTAWYVYETNGETTTWKKLADTANDEYLYSEQVFYVIAKTETVDSVPVTKSTIYSSDGTALVSNIELEFDYTLYGSDIEEGAAVIVYTAENVWKITIA